MSPPRTAANTPNETCFLTGREYADDLQIKIAVDLNLTHIAMFTDGIQNLVLDYRNGDVPTPYAPFFRNVFTWLKSQPDELQAYTGLRRFLRSAAVSNRTNDDVSLLLASLSHR